MIRSIQTKAALVSAENCELEISQDVAHKQRPNYEDGDLEAK